MALSTQESEARNSQTSNHVLPAPSKDDIKKKDDSLGKTEKSATSNVGQNNSKIEKSKNSNDAAQTSSFKPAAPVSTKTDESLIRPVNNRQEFDTLIETIKDKYVIVWFSAIWCGPCKTLGEKFQELAQKYRNKIEILKVDVDDLEDLAMENEVSTMPAYLVMRNGQKLAHYFGSTQEHIDELIEKYLKEKSN